LLPIVTNVSDVTNPQIQVFLKRGVPLHMPNKTGALGLHCAAAMGHVGMVQQLLQKGTNVDVRTKDGYSALHVAVQSGRPEVIETLLGCGADVQVKGCVA
jgi:ankyrin repeat protein